MPSNSILGLHNVLIEDISVTIIDAKEGALNFDNFTIQDSIIDSDRISI